MSEHAKKSPSAAESWMECLGYLNAIEGLPNITSEPAAEGIAAHTMSDMCFTTGMDAEDFIGVKSTVAGFTFVWNEYDAELLQYGIDAVRAREGKFFGEHRVDLTNWLGPDQFGTLDRAIVSDDLIIINDLKWGRGIAVSPVKNKQLMLYALGFWWNVASKVSKATNFKIIIDQPRQAGGGGEWDVTLDELLAFGEEARESSLRTNDLNAPRSASLKACAFCPRREQPGGCVTFDKFNLDLLGMSYDTVERAVTGEQELQFEREMTPEQLSYLVLHKTIITKWLTDLSSECMTRALNGDPTPGAKAVIYRNPPRKWKDEDEALDTFNPILGGKLFNSKIKSPTQVEKAIGKSEFKSYRDLVDKGEPSMTLVSDADARPAQSPASEKFDEVED